MAELRAVAAEAIRDAVARQIDLGLDVIGDGELNRGYFLNSLYDGVDGLESLSEEQDPIFARLEPTWPGPCTRWPTRWPRSWPSCGR